MRLCELFFILVLLSALILRETISYQYGNRVVAASSSQHANTRTPWSDFPLSAMPSFGVPGTVIFHATVPKYTNTTGTETFRNTSYPFEALK